MIKMTGFCACGKAGRYFNSITNKVSCSKEGNCKERSEILRENLELKSILQIAWDSICEAGYEDHSAELKASIDKYLN